MGNELSQCFIIAGMKDPLGIYHGEYKILGSTFCAEIGPLSDKDDFKGTMEAFKAKFPKADHYPYAYRLGGYGKSSDDGEPGGTAGRPLLSLLEEKDINGAYILVARYFGGTKLGVPRLRRSFLEAAIEAIEKAGFGEEKEIATYYVKIPYGQLESFKALAKRKGVRIEKIEYLVEEVALTLDFDATILLPVRELGLTEGQVTNLGTSIKLLKE